MKSILAFMVIIGTVIGSGFLSGKEIVVFFSRFGVLSFPCIILAFFLFFFLFTFFFEHGSKAILKLEKSRFSTIINLLVCLILSSAMFAGCKEVIGFYPNFLKTIFFIVLILYCFYIIKKGVGGLEKSNLVLVPIMVIVLIFSLFKSVDLTKLTIVHKPQLSLLSVVYSALYVLLNTSNSCIVLAKLGQNLSKPQKMRVAFFSALALCCILLFANFVLLQNPNVFSKDMPLLALFQGWQSLVMQIIVLLGCVTTLFSLVFTSSSSMRGLCKSRFCIVFVSVLLPFILSFFGFGKIVSLLYPLTSVLSIFLLGDLFFIPLFKRAYTKIHSRSKNTE